VVLVMMDWDEQRAALVTALKQRGVAVRVLCMKPEKRPTGLDPSELVHLK
jgi:L-ribulose-5-phosphate 3-epimerase UlaE